MGQLMMAGINRLQEYDEILKRKGDSIIARFRHKDTQKEHPIDRHPFLLEYLRYCVCKLYGIGGELEEHKAAYSVFVFLYWKTGQISYGEMVKNIGGDKGNHCRSVKQVMQEQDQLRIKKNQYLQQKVEEFYKNM